MICQGVLTPRQVYGWRNALPRQKHRDVLDDFPGDHSTNGGSRETDENEFAVMPSGPRGGLHRYDCHARCKPPKGAAQVCCIVLIGGKMVQAICHDAAVPRVGAIVQTPKHLGTGGA